MAKFNLKEHIAKNKATFFGSLTEGQFSWMTQDTGQQIGSQEENTIPVYMFDDKGKYWFEPSYDGYGVFGGMDYYELLDQMNGGRGDRSEGIRKAFDPTAEGKLLFPALVVSPNNFNYKTHDFTKEAETDPDQSWLPYEEDNKDDYDDYGMGGGFGDMDKPEDYDDEDNMMEGYDEFKRVEKGKKKTVAKDKGEEDVYGAGVKKGEEIEKKKMKMSEFKAKIKEMVLAEYERDVNITNTNPESEVDFLAELENMLNEAEGLTPLQDYVYQYEIEISGEDQAQEFLDDIKQLNTPQDVYDYYAYERGWKGSDLDNIFRQVKRKFASLNKADELTPLQKQAYSYAKERFGFEDAKNSLDQIKTLTTKEEFSDWVQKKIEAEKGLNEGVWSVLPARIPEFIAKVEELKDEYHGVVGSDDVYDGLDMAIRAAKELMNLKEAEGDTEKDTAETDVTDVTVDDTETIDTETTAEVDPNVKAVQDALTQAQAAAQKLGDKKLTDQIGNTITFFTRAHVVDKGAVAEAYTPDEITLANKQYVLDWWEELPFETKKEIFHQYQEAGDAANRYKMNESMFPMLKKILK